MPYLTHCVGTGVVLVLNRPISNKYPGCIRVLPPLPKIANSIVFSFFFFFFFFFFVCVCYPCLQRIILFRNIYHEIFHTKQDLH